MATRMQQRRGTAAQWISTNSGNGPILAAGEIGFESDTNKFKVGDGVNHWVDLTYFTDTDSITTALNSIIDGAPAALNTLNELAAALGDDPNFLASLATETYVDTAVANSTFDASLAAGTGLDWNATTDQFDIDSTVATKTYANDAVSTHSADTTLVHGIADTSVLATTTDISNHNSDTTNVHGITDTSALVTTTTLTANLSSKADLESPTFSGTVTLPTGTVTSGMIAEGTIVDADINASAAIAQSKISGLSTSLGLKADLNDPTFTGTVTLPTGTVTSGMILDGTIVNGDISDSAAIDKTKISGTAITAADTGTVTSTMIANGTIVDADINASAAIAQSKIADLTTDLAAKAPLADPTFTGTVVLPSTTSIGDVSSTEIGYVNGVTSAIQTQIDSKLALDGGTMTGALTLSGAPTSDLHAATKLYVDNVTAGINFHESVHAASTVNISANYSNGTNGVGATLTADTNRAFSTLDGESVTLGQRVLVKNQTDAKQNGIYTLTTVGSVSVPWVLTRATDADNNPTGEMKNGDFVLVMNGTTQASVGYINNSATNPIVIGTDNITYTEFSAGKTVVAGDGLAELTPGTLSIASGGVTSTMIADGAIVDADVNASAAIAQSKISGLTSDLAAKAPLADPTFTGTVTVSASGVAFTDGTQTKEGVPSRTTINSVTDTYNLSTGGLALRDSLIECNKSTGFTVTIPTNATTAYPVGTSIDILQTGAGQVTIAGAVGVTVNATPGLKLRTQWSSATLFKRATDTWVVMGDLSA